MKTEFRIYLMTRDLWRRILPDLSLIVFLLVFPLLMFHQQTLGDRTLLPTENLYQFLPHAAYREVVGAPAVPHNHLISDMVLQNYQWKSFIREQISQGKSPFGTRISCRCAFLGGWAAIPLCTRSALFIMCCP